MAYKVREEIVGKRFLSICGGAKLKLSKIHEWGWRAGVIRASSHKDSSHEELQVLVEYDDVEWQRREWLSIYKEDLFKLFLVEQSLVWSERPDPSSSKATPALVKWPALTFTALVSCVELTPPHQPVEHLLDREIAFRDYSLLQPFQAWDSTLVGSRENSQLHGAVRRWAEQQDGQRILVTTPSVLFGYRVEVYRAEGTTQWYTAVIKRYNEASGDLTVTDDTVLEEHNEDPSIVQMRLIGDGVVESIMRGESVGITPRRSRSSVLTQHQPQLPRVGRIAVAVAVAPSAPRKPRAKLPAPRPRRSSPGVPLISAKGIQGTACPSKRTRGKRKSEEVPSVNPPPQTPQTPTSPPPPPPPPPANKEDVENKKRAPAKRKPKLRKKVLEEAAQKNRKKLRTRVPTPAVERCSLRHRKTVATAAAPDATSSTPVDEEVAVVAECVPLTVPPSEVPRTEDTSAPVPSEVPSAASLTECHVLLPVTGAVTRDADQASEPSAPQSDAVDAGVCDDDDDDVRVSPSVENVVRVPRPLSSGGETARSVGGVPDCASSSQEDDDVPLCSSSPFSRMELAGDPGVTLLRFPDDRSDSGVSSLRSGSCASGDERSGSRSSALSSSDEPAPNAANAANASSSNRSPLFLQQAANAAAAAANAGGSESKLGAPEPVRVWRDPSLLQLEPHVRHVQSVQHQSLLMSHSAAAQASAQASAQPSAPPPSAAASAAERSAASERNTQALLAAHYAQPPALLAAHPMHHHPHLPPPGLYAQMPEMLWKPRYAPLPVGAHMMGSAHPAAEEQLERERAYAQDMSRHERLIRERHDQEVRDMEKKHKERQEREKQERDKQQMDREREQRQEREQDRERQEKQRAAEQAVHKHFEESLRLAHQKQRMASWNVINTVPQQQQQQPPSRERVEAEERKRAAELDALHHQQRERQIANSERLRQDAVRERGYFVQSPASSQRSSGPKPEYPPPAHSRSQPKPSPHSEKPHAALPKAEPNFNLFGYPAYQPVGFLSHDGKPKPAISVKSERDMMLPNPPPLMSDHKGSSVIVKNEHKLHSPKHQLHQQQQQQQQQHYQQQKAQYEYIRGQRYAASPHHAMEPAKTAHRGGQPSPHALRPAPHPSPPERYQYAAPKASVASYPYPSPAAAHYPPPAANQAALKPKVSSPAPAHIYGKPTAGIVAGISTGLPRQEVVVTAPPTKAPSPYMTAPPPQSHPPPPPAHSSHGRFEYRPGGNVHAPIAFQTQPLDLGVAGNRDDAGSPKRKGVSIANVAAIAAEKRRRCEAPPPPQLARVCEPSPLIANAATTITTVVNAAAFCAPTATPPATSPRPSSAGSAGAVARGSPAPSPPFTPAKVQADSDKSNSPGPSRASNYPVHKLKKAWLQRHSGEDGAEDTTGLVGGGTCVTLPMSVAVKDSSNSSASSPGGGAKRSPGKPRKGSPVGKEPLLNGHGGGADLLPKPSIDDSSSSESEARKTPPKRKPPKAKRKKGNGSAARKAAAEEKRKRLAAAAASDSGSDSDNESASDKDSDSGTSATQSGGGKKPNGGGSSARKRGRRPKPSKNESREEPRPKKGRPEPPVSAARDPFQKPPVGQLKKTGESFLQDGACFEVAPKLAKCRECRWTPNQRSKNTPNIFCRFYAFRRLRYTKNGQLAIAGFSDPIRDSAEEDLRLWLPYPDTQPADLDVDMARLLLAQVGDQFCDLLEQEKGAINVHMSEDKTIAWKRVVQGVREMCDVCDTTLFNFHWACGKCGFVVCIDCYRGRKSDSVKIWGDASKEGKDGFAWLHCTNRAAHEQDKLMLTQIIAGDSLLALGRKVHEVRTQWRIPQYCGCPEIKEEFVVLKDGTNGACMESFIHAQTLNGLLNVRKENEKLKEKNGATNGDVKSDSKSTLSWLADVALSNEDKKSGDGSGGDSEDDREGNYSTLRELLIRPSHKPNGSRSSSPGALPTAKKSRLDTLDDIISSVIEHSVARDENGDAVATKPTAASESELKHFVRRSARRGRDPLPIRVMNLGVSKLLYPDVPHAWLCDGRLLRLTDPTHRGNAAIFQDQWKRGQPVVVSDVSKHLDMSLWSPDSFTRDFGDEKNDLVNCMTGKVVPQQPMRKFWDGFEHFSKRLKDESGTSMLLKLKDWPPGEDFAEMLPSRFTDLMRVLPMPEYTHRSGKLNLASRLPDCFVRPDLGPKMYNAYGSALFPNKGTTNLHLDISDAVNVMVYVGIPKDGDDDEHIKEAFRAIDEAGCDILTRRRVRERGEMPGALWHIYQSRDADKIRDLLNKVSVERGSGLEPHNDPIHDQSWYLDSILRERLYKEYGVQGYAIVQCLGDSVFIPAGAPHQVRNLHNCIKVAEDFVSPENISHCFHLTQEFRELTNDHMNHEDKLQIKNIIYHAVKDSLAVLSKLSANDTPKEPQENGRQSPVPSADGSSSSSGDSLLTPKVETKTEPETTTEIKTEVKTERTEV